MKQGIVLALAALTVIGLFIGAAIIDHNTTQYMGGDWYLIQEPIARGVRYDALMFNPPWIALLLYPVALLPTHIGHGLIAGLSLITFMVVMYHIYPANPLVMLAVLASYPIVRLMFEGNVELLTVAGLFLLYYALEHDRPLLYSGGVLFAGGKLQETLLVLAASVAYLIVRRKWQFLWRAALYTLPVVGVTMAWRGQAWLANLPTGYEFFSLNTFVSGPLYAGIAAALALLSLALVDYHRPLLASYPMLVATTLFIAPYTGVVGLVVVAVFATYFHLTRGSKLLGVLSLLSLYGAYVGGKDAVPYFGWLLLLHVVALIGYQIVSRRETRSRSALSQPIAQ